jgi:hypothetical protein
MRPQGELVAGDTGLFPAIKDISTENLRMALRHYRSFFDRLLSI